MEKIVLTEKQLEVLEKQVDGKFSPFFAKEEEIIALNEVIEMASELEKELNAYNEVKGDLMLWFLEKYRGQ